MKKKGEIEFNKVLAWKIDLVLLVIHACLLLFFAVMQVWIMACVNVVSVCIYGVMLHVSKRNSYLFLLVTYSEILLHMILAILCVGWDFGFQLYCFALIPVIFYSDYQGKSTRAKTCHPIMVSIMMIFVFLALRVYTCYIGTPYNVGNTAVIMIGNMMNAVFVFIFLISYMANYERLTIHTQHVASKDELTGLNNRHKMRDIMQVVMEQQGNQKNLAFSILDIDNFKKINDTYGHSAGDIVLQAVAKKIGSLEGDNIHVCRWGGEEFLILVSGECCYDELKVSMDSLIRQVRELVVPCDGQRIAVTITAGAAQGHPQEAMDDIISRADQYLYEGKLSGKNKLVARD